MGWLGSKIPETMAVKYFISVITPMRLEKVHGKLFQIKPFIWRAFKGSVVKVEPIDVNGSSHLPMPHKKAGAAEATPRPRSKPWG